MYAHHKEFFLVITFFCVVSFSACGGNGSNERAPAALSTVASNTTTSNSLVSKEESSNVSTGSKLVPGQWGRRMRRLPERPLNCEKASKSEETDVRSEATGMLLSSKTVEPLTGNAFNPLAGTWKSGKARLIVAQDNRYSYFKNGDQAMVPDVFGTVAVSGNIVLITDAGGKYSCEKNLDEDAQGSYTFVISGNELKFSPMSDACHRRAKFLDHTYTN